MTRRFSLLLVFAAIFLGLILASSGASEEVLSGHNVYVLGQHAYVAAGANGLSIVEVRRSENPKQVASVNTAGEAKGVYTVGSYAYVAVGSAGLQIFGVRNPASPKKASAGNSLATANAPANPATK